MNVEFWMRFRMLIKFVLIFNSFLQYSSFLRLVVKIVLLYTSVEKWPIIYRALLHLEHIAPKETMFEITSHQSFILVVLLIIIFFQLCNIDPRNLFLNFLSLLVNTFMSLIFFFGGLSLLVLLAKLCKSNDKIIQKTNTVL